MKDGGKKPIAAGDVGVKPGRSDLVRMGLFSEVQYVSNGESYNSKKQACALDYRTKGKQFLIAPPKQGQNTRDAYFNKEYIRLFENEPYTDLVSLRRQWRIQAKEKNISTTPFNPCSVPPKASGKGSHWGTIEQQWPMDSKGFNRPPSQKSKEDDIPIHEPRNFLTASPKKGSGYGYPGVTIGKPYQYESDPFDRGDQLAKHERSEHKKKMTGVRPFISSSATHDFFYPFAGISGSKDSKDVNVSSEGTSNAVKKVSLPSIPFKPSSCCAKTINPYPSYEAPHNVPEPPTEKGVPPSAVRRGMIFKPSGVTGSYPVKSIIEASCTLAAPSWIQDSLTSAILAAE
ncbi:hypothetical protein BASA62_010343 [Batrachochytrium salamandrivorans]|nr:hypothetical protein BASA62_010343 [Batrachochytrium salamandrivorans]